MRGADESSTRYPDLAVEPVSAEVNLPQGGSHLVRLSPRVMAVADQSWEVILLHRRGRVVLKDGPSTWISHALSIVTFREAPWTHEVALATEDVVLAHSDPADRLLAATAK